MHSDFSLNNSNESCLFRLHHGPNNVRLSFSHTHCWYEVGMFDTESVGVKIAIYHEFESHRSEQTRLGIWASIVDF